MPTTPTYEYQIHQFILNKWEEVSAEPTLEEARQVVKDYRANQPQYPVKIIKVKED